MTKELKNKFSKYFFESKVALGIAADESEMCGKTKRTVTRSKIVIVDFRGIFFISVSLPLAPV